jgi:L-glyceraldehyde 3-phosphate reductase
MIFFLLKVNLIISDLNQIAKKRDQTLSQMALAWVFNNKAVTTALIGASSVKQVKENIESLDNLNFSKSELQEINKKAKEGNINKWKRSSSY